MMTKTIIIIITIKVIIKVIIKVQHTLHACKPLVASQVCALEP